MRVCESLFCRTCFLAVLFSLSGSLGASGAEKPPQGPAAASEDALRDKIDQLQRELDALREELHRLRGRQDRPDPGKGAAAAALEEAPRPASEAAREPAAPAPAAGQQGQPAEPFAFADFSWLNGNSRTTESPLATKVFTGEFRADTSYILDFSHPKDATLVGTTESGRTGEVQVQQLGVGGDFSYNHVRGRLMTQFGLYSTMTPRNDASPARGQWDLAGAYRYLSEAYGG
jgi:hypothetical protein